jgi:hypothetical protein
MASLRISSMMWPLDLQRGSACVGNKDPTVFVRSKLDRGWLLNPGLFQSKDISIETEGMLNPFWRTPPQFCLYDCRNLFSYAQHLTLTNVLYHLVNYATVNMFHSVTFFGWAYCLEPAFADTMYAYIYKCNLYIYISNIYICYIYM